MRADFITVMVLIVGSLTASRMRLDGNFIDAGDAEHEVRSLRPGRRVTSRIASKDSFTSPRGERASFRAPVIAIDHCSANIGLG
jgi:hypothetical protein